eukprot:GEMP01033727.1.p1 GENE.GEMP01033727.1~~GEMP01033727.1.p1  ORF type:complete len:307 (+),score=60.15 GEMP01033727.1:167-1087(+)
MVIDSVLDANASTVDYPHARWALPHQLAPGYPRGKGMDAIAITTIYPSQKMDHYMGIKSAVNMRTAAERLDKASLQSVTVSKAATVARIRAEEALREWQALQENPQVLRAAPLNAFTSLRASMESTRQLAAGGQNLVRNILEAREAARLAALDLSDAAHVLYPGQDIIAPINARRKALQRLHVPPSPVYTLTQRGCMPVNCDMCYPDNLHKCIVCKDGSTPNGEGDCIPIPGGADLLQETRKNSLELAIRNQKTAGNAITEGSATNNESEPKPFRNSYYDFLQATAPFKDTKISHGALEKASLAFL